MALALTSLAAHAQVKPGEYVLGAGFGTLNITPDKGDTLRFRLEARGGNFHSCSLSGLIRNGEARMEDSTNEKLPCIVTFKVQKNGLDVGSLHEGTCTTYCGMRAHFEGAYNTPPADCTPSLVRQKRNRFNLNFA